MEDKAADKSISIPSVIIDNNDIYKMFKIYYLSKAISKLLI